MPKRDRVRARARHVARTAPAPARPEAAVLERERPERRTRYRTGGVGPAGTRAVGVASASLERAATLERGYVVKDFGRLGKVVALMFLLLVLSGFAVNAVIR